MVKVNMCILRFIAELSLVFIYTVYVHTHILIQILYIYLPMPPTIIYWTDSIHPVSRSVCDVCFDCYLEQFSCIHACSMDLIMQSAVLHTYFKALIATWAPNKLKPSSPHIMFGSPHERGLPGWTITTYNFDLK